MPMATVQTQPQANAVELMEGIYRDGIVGVSNLLPTAWGDALDADLKSEFMAAMSQAGGTAPRGWNRFYFEPYAERIRGFLDLISHPLIVDLSRRMFGDDYMVVELGADVPLPGAINQPWHRDFPMPRETREGRLTSIAINASSVDVTPDMGPFQIVPGTHFDPGDGFDGGMFPDESRYPEFEGRFESRLGKRGSVSIRSGLAIHRGSRSDNRSRLRPVAIVGIVSREDRAVKKRLANPDDPDAPRLRVSQQYIDGIPEEIRSCLSYEVVADSSESLPPHFTHHTFEGLKMSEMV
jgi:hypothetical protein